MHVNEGQREREIEGKGEAEEEGGWVGLPVGNRKSISAHKTQNSQESNTARWTEERERGVGYTLTFHSFIHSSF